MCVSLLLLSSALPAGAWSPAELFEPCRGDCAVALYAGTYVENSLSKVLITQPEVPLTWDYASNDHLVATSVSRRAGRLWKFDLEPEVGIGQRFGRQSATEVWGALFVRYRLPFKRPVLTSIAVSTGLNWASEITDVEQDRARDDIGSQVMHFFSPEITFALPSRPDVELLFRFHHRSGVFGVVSDAQGGAQYGSVGLRVRF